MASSSSTVVINDYRGVRTQQRTRSSGKRTTTLSIEAEPIAVNLDDRELSKRAADAYVADLRRQIASIAMLASPATIATREARAAAFARGEPWARKQYAGGRMGAMPPHKTDRLYNDSGRLAAGITSNWSTQERAWIVRFPANRFAPDFMSRPGAQAVLDRLVDLVPALRNPITDAVSEAIGDSQRDMLRKLRDQRALDRARLAVDVLEFVARAVAA